MNSYYCSIYASVRAEKASPVDLSKRFLRTLSEVAKCSSPVSDWRLMPRPFARDSLTFDEACGNIEKFVGDNVATVDMQPDIDLGYHLAARNKLGMQADSLGLSAKIGGKFDAKIEFEVGFIGTPSDLSVVSYPLFKSVLSIFIEQWPVIWANADIYWRDYYKSASAPGAMPHPYSRYSVPWISYLSAPLVEGFKPPPDIQAERTPGGGLIMIATENRPDPTNSEEMQRSRKIAEIMIARAGDP